MLHRCFLFFISLSKIIQIKSSYLNVCYLLVFVFLVFFLMWVWFLFCFLNCNYVVSITSASDRKWEEPKKWEHILKMIKTMLHICIYIYYTWINSTNVSFLFCFNKLFNNFLFFFIIHLLIWSWSKTNFKSTKYRQLFKNCIHQSMSYFFKKERKITLTMIIY